MGVDIDELKAAVMAGEGGWRRLNAKYGGLVKPAITFFGENLPKRFLECLKTDFRNCKLLLVFGTSLMVQPFASLVRRAPSGTPRLLVNRERRGEDMGLDFDTPGSSDGLFLGDCDAGARGLAALLGWDIDCNGHGGVGGEGGAAAGGDGLSAATGDAPPAKVRLGITRRETSKQPDSIVLVTPTYEAIATAAAHKLRMPLKNIRRLVLLKTALGHPTGTALPPSGDCSDYVTNDALLWVSTTEGAPSSTTFVV